MGRSLIDHGLTNALVSLSRSAAIAGNSSSSSWEDVRHTAGRAARIRPRGPSPLSWGRRTVVDTSPLSTAWRKSMSATSRPSSASRRPVHHQQNLDGRRMAFRQQPFRGSVPALGRAPVAHRHGHPAGCTVSSTVLGDSASSATT